MQHPASFNCALITGGKSGLGKAITTLLQKKGIRVIAISSSDYNLRNKNEKKALCELISLEKPDLIINNAGFGFYGPAINHPLEDQLAIIEVNSLAVAEITLHAAKTLKNAKIPGTILNISSAAALVPFPTFSTYAASKRFVYSFSESLDYELRNFGIRILCALPGQISTDFRKRASKGHLQKSSFLAMSPQYAAVQIWKQVLKGKQLHIFDWRTRVMLWCSFFLPKAFCAYLMQKSISARYLDGLSN